jgi:hypothetical protein
MHIELAMYLIFNIISIACLNHKIYRKITRYVIMASVLSNETGSFSIPNNVRLRNEQKTMWKPQILQKLCYFSKPNTCRLNISILHVKNPENSRKYLKRCYEFGSAWEETSFVVQACEWRHESKISLSVLSSVKLRVRSTCSFWSWE